MTIPEQTVVQSYPHTVRHTENIWVPMPDGAHLAARIWMPDDAEQKPVPAILEYLPYRKRDGTRVRDDCRHEYWAGHGYACIRLDIRGTGDSDGQITDEYTKSEQDDAVAAIAWIAEQPWCTGSVGMTGISWGGFNSLQVAARRPPALKTIITHCSTDDRYADDVHFMGGCMVNDGFFWGSVFYHMMAGGPDPEIVGDRWRDQWLTRMENWQPPTSHIWMKHQRRDDYWRHGSVCENYDDIDIPVFAVGGWEDGYSNAVPRLLANLKTPSKGLIGPWGHKYPESGIPGPAIGFLQHALRWWDKWLKDEETGIMEEPAYTVYMHDFTPPDACLPYMPGRWVTEPSWPSPNIETRTLTLNSGGLSDTAGDAVALTHISPQTLGATGGSWCPYGMGGSSPDLALDQREDDGQSLVFDSGPLDDALELLGAPVFRARIAVDQEQAFLAVRLNDVAPDGTSRRITFGLLNLCHREDREHISPMKPGEWTDVSIKLNDLAHSVAPGHRLRVAISTCYWPMIWPSAHPVELSLMAGESKIDLPVRPGRDEPAVTFDPPVVSPVGATTEIEPASSSRSLERDFASGRWTETLVEDSGIYRIEDIDLEISDGMTCTYSISEGDPLSAEGVWRWHTTRSRGDWDIGIYTETRLRATETEWLIDTDIDAQEDGRSIFSKAWRERIPRDGM